MEREVRRPVPPEGSRWLPVGRGGAALVDEEDYARLSGYRWMLTNIAGRPHAFRRATTGPACLRHRGKYRDGRPRVANVRPRVYLHREVMGLERGDRRRVSFRDGDPLNCRRSNLRLQTGGSAFRVAQHYRNKPYRAAAYVDGRVVYLGQWHTREQADFVRESVAPLARELSGKGYTPKQVKKMLQKAAGLR